VRRRDVVDLDLDAGVLGEAHGDLVQLLVHERREVVPAEVGDLSLLPARGWDTGGEDTGQAGAGRGGQKAATRDRCHESSSVVHCACASRRGGALSSSIGVTVRGNRSSNMT